mgnify:CR=1 FL=1
MNRGISYDVWLQDEKAYEEYAGDYAPVNPLDAEHEKKVEEEIAREERGNSRALHDYNADV